MGNIQNLYHSNSFTADSDGNVGIGTTDPQNPLHIKKEGYQLKLEDGNTTNTCEILASNNTMGFFSDRANAVASSDMIFSIDNDTKMVIDTNGDVGIGTTNPIYKLDVVSAGDGLLSLTGATKPAMIFKVGTAVVGGIQAQANTSLNVSAYGTSSLNLQTAGTTPRLTILTGGNVGINQTAPAGILHVQDAVTGDTSQFLITNGTGATLRMGITGSGTNENAHILTNSGEDLEFQIGKAADAVTPSVIFKSGGNVGIGTNSPNTQLEILNNNDQPATLRLSSSVSDGDAVAAIISFENESDNGGVQGRIENIIDSNEDGSTSFKFYTNNTSTPAMTLFNGGSTTIAGAATATNFILSSDKTLKEKIKDIETKHVDVEWKNFELISEPGVKRSGVVAQELEEKHPEFVRTDKDGLKSVAYIDLLITKIAELEARLEKLEITT